MGPDSQPVYHKVALIGGVYSNYLALQAVLDDARRRGAEAIYCLGDVGAFGPYPNRSCEILRGNTIPTIRGNYDDAIGHGRSDCQCGYTDPRDNYFARLSYAYTYQNTAAEHQQWFCDLPAEIRFFLGEYRVLLCHGSPRRTNEFLWESTTSTHFLSKLCADYQADIICATHTGLHWQRRLPCGSCFVNVGVVGRPENDGHTNIGYTLLTLEADRKKTKEISADGRLTVEYIRVEYDFQKLAADMRSENLPEEFVQTILTGWWTTCLEILPAKERKRGRY